MSRLSFLAGLCCTLFLLSGCTNPPALSDGDSQVYSRLHKKYNRMESYAATVRVTIKSNKTENQYTLRQNVKSPEQAVMILEEPKEFAGTTTVFSGDSIVVTGETSITVPANDSLNDLILHHFFSQYYKSEETALSVSTSSERQGHILLETVSIPADDKRYKLTLRCNSKTLEPEQLTVYDAGGNIRMVADYSDFSYNPTFDADMFTIE